MEFVGNLVALLSYLSLTIILTKMIFGEDDHHKY